MRQCHVVCRCLMRALRMIYMPMMRLFTRSADVERVATTAASAMRSDVVSACAREARYTQCQGADREARAQYAAREPARYACSTTPIHQLCHSVRVLCVIYAAGASLCDADAAADVTTILEEAVTSCRCYAALINSRRWRCLFRFVFTFIILIFSAAVDVATLSIRCRHTPPPA